MTIIQNTIVDASGAVLGDEDLYIDLVGAGWLTDGTKRQVLGRYKATTNEATGLWTVDLPPSANMDPLNTYYEVKQHGVTTTFTVPSTGGPYWLHDVAITGPIPGVPANLFPASLADGQLVAWSATAGAFVAVNPTGASELAAASNTSGTGQTASANGTVGAAVVITGCSITLPSSGGRPVTIHYRAAFQQTAVGSGDLYLSVRKNGTATPSAILPLPNSTAGSHSLITVSDFWSIGPTTGADTYSLQFLLYADPAQTPSASVLNSTTQPSLIRAVAG